MVQELIGLQKPIGAAMGSPINSIARRATLLAKQRRTLKVAHMVMNGTTITINAAKVSDYAIYSRDGMVPLKQQ